MELPPELVSQLKYARQRVRALHGKKEARGSLFDNNRHLSDEEISKLAKEFEKLPAGDKRREEIKRRIFELEFLRGYNRGYDRSYYD